MLRIVLPIGILWIFRILNNEQHTSLVEVQNAFHPLIHIKRGLIKIFLKAMAPDGCEFQYLKVKFSTERSDAKLKSDIFIELEIIELMPERNTKVNWMHLS